MGNFFFFIAFLASFMDEVYDMSFKPLEAGRYEEYVARARLVHVGGGIGRKVRCLCSLD